MVHQQLSKFYDGFRRSAHPMAIMVGVVGALSAFYEDTLDIENEEHRIHACYRMVAKMPTIAAMALKYSIGQPFIYPRNRMTYCDNFLRMCFGVPTESYKNNKVLSEAINRILILHADHEQNASTSTVRQAGSSGANPFACIASGIACLWGPAHGGANEAALNMLETIKNKKNIPEYIARAKNKEDPFKSPDLAILKYSVPDFIKNNSDLMKKINMIDFNSVNSPLQGSFDITLKKKL